MSVELTAEDRAMLEGDRGEASAMAMRIIASMADVSGAAHLLDVTSAHIDGCLYHGPAGLDFARRLANGGGRVAVPTTLNVSSLDLLHPELVHLDDGHPRGRPRPDGDLRGDGLPLHVDVRALPTPHATVPR